MFRHILVFIIILFILGFNNSDAENLKAEISLSKYTNPNFGFSIDFPSNWNLAESHTEKAWATAVEPGGMRSITVGRFEVPNQDIEKGIHNILTKPKIEEQISKIGANFSLLDYKKVAFQNLDAILTVMRVKLPCEKSDKRCWAIKRNLKFFQNGHLYFVDFVTSGKTESEVMKLYNESQNIYRHLLNSFRTIP